MWTCVVISFVYIPRIKLFNSVRNCPNVFQSGCTILYSNQQYIKIPVLCSMSFLYILNVNPLLHTVCKYFLWFYKLPFHLVDSFLCFIEIFSMIWSHLLIFAFLAYAFFVSGVKKIVAKANVQELEFCWFAYAESFSHPSGKSYLIIV